MEADAIIFTHPQSLHADTLRRVQVSVTGRMETRRTAGKSMLCEARGACRIRRVQVHLLRNGEKPTGNCHFNVQVSSVRCRTEAAITSASASCDRLNPPEEATCQCNTIAMHGNRQVLC